MQEAAHSIVGDGQATKTLIADAEAFLFQNLPEFIHIAEPAGADPDGPHVYAQGKNAAHRSKLTTASSSRTPLPLGGDVGDVIIVEEECQAALALSDLVNLSELSSASLLVQLRSQEGESSSSLLSRALCLYHESKTVLLDAVHILLVARVGRTYHANTFAKDFHAVATRVVDSIPTLTGSMLYLAYCALVQHKQELAVLKTHPHVSEADLTAALDRKYTVIGDCIFDIGCQMTITSTPQKHSGPVMVDEDVSVYARVLQRIANDPTVATDYLSVSLVVGFMSLLQAPHSSAVVDALQGDVGWSNLTIYRLLKTVHAYARHTPNTAAESSKGVVSFLLSMVDAPQFQKGHLLQYFHVDVLYSFISNKLATAPPLMMSRSFIGDAQATQQDCDFLNLMSLVTMNDHAPDRIAAIWQQWDVSSSSNHITVSTPLCVPFLNMLAGLSGPRGAHLVFDLMVDNARARYRDTDLSWTGLFSLIKREVTDTTLLKLQAGAREPYLQHVLFLQNTLTAYLAVMKRVVTHDGDAVVKLLQNRDLAVIDCLCALMVYPITTALKAAVFGALQSLCVISEAAQTIIVFLDHYDVMGPNGIVLEAEQEAEEKVYHETIAFLELVYVLLPKLMTSSVFHVYLGFVVNSVFHRFVNRAYLMADQKWQIATACMQVFSYIVDHYTPTTSEGDDLDLFHETEILGDPAAIVLRIFDDVIIPLSKTTTMVPKSAQEKCLLQALTLTMKFFQKQEVLCAAHKMPALESILNMSQFRAETRLFERLSALLRLVSHVFADEISLQALHVLWACSQSAELQAGLGTSLRRLGESASVNVIIRSFAARVHDVVMETEGNDVQDILDMDHASHSNAIAYSIVHFLLHNIRKATPNIAHILLGFPLSATTLNDLRSASLSILESSSRPSCLRTLLNIMAQGLNSSKESQLTFTNPIFSELSHRLMYQLCRDRYTAPAVMEYLRLHHTFVLRHLGAATPIRHVAVTSSYTANVVPALLNQQAWLLKVIAMELHITSSKRDHVHAHVLDLLFKPPKETNVDVLGDQMMVLWLCDAVDLVQPPLPSVTITYFDRDKVNKMHEECVRGVGEGNDHIMLCDLDKLHELLQADMADYNGGKDGSDELESIMVAASQMNLNKKVHAATVHFMQAWQRVIVVALTKFSHLIPIGDRSNIITNIITYLFAKMSFDGIAAEIMTVVSELLVILMASLRQAFLDGSAIEGKVTQAKLRNILIGVSTAVLRADNSPRTRQNLYAALLFCMQISSSLGEGSGTFRSGSGDHFMHALARDASLPPGSGAVLSLASLDAVIGQDSQEQWLNFVQSMGYLSQYVDELHHLNTDLLSLLGPSPQDILSLYVYQARMCLLERIILTKGGVDALMRAEVIHAFTMMTFLDARPASDQLEGLGLDDVYAPPIERYRQLAIPALVVVTAMIVNGGSSIARVVTQAQAFVVAHMESLFLPVLKEHSSVSPMMAHELSLVTGLIQVLAQWCSEVGSPLPSSPFARLRMAMLTLVDKIADLTSWEGRVRTEMSEKEKESLSLHLHSTLSHVVAFSRIAMASDAGAISVVYRANIHTAADFSIQSFPPLNSLLRVIETTSKAYRVALAALEKHKEELSKGVEDVRQGSVDSQAERLRKAKLRLTEQINFDKLLLQTSLISSENALYVLWRHLDWYFTDHHLTRGARPDSTPHARRLGVHVPGSGVKQVVTGTALDLKAFEMTRAEQLQLQGEVASAIASALPTSLYPLVTDEQARLRGSADQRAFVEPLVRRLAAFVRDAASA